MNRKTLLFRPKGTEYLLYDKFVTNRVAGAVNGTPAEPLGGARVVVDTTSKLSLSGGILAMSGYNAAGDPGIWWSAQTRIAGKILIGEAQVAATNPNIDIIGFDGNQSGNISNCINFTSGIIRAIVYGSAVNTVAFAINTLYKLAVVLRASGQFYFIKGGVYTNWTLIMESITPSGATFYPASAWRGTLTSAIQLSNVRIPVSCWLPSPVASDSFTRDNGAIGITDGLAHGENSGIGAGGSALAWNGNTWTIASNFAVNTPTLGSEIVVNGNMESGDPPTSWVAYLASVLDGVADERTGGAGVQSLDATSGATDTWAANQPVTLTVGTWYFISGWAKVRTATSVAFGAYTTTMGTKFVPSITSSSWTQEFTAFRWIGTGQVWCQCSPVLTAGRFDDISLKALTLSELFSSLQSGKSDYQARVALTRPTTSRAPLGMVLNLDSAANPQNFIVAYIDGVNAYLDKCVAGTYTSVISGSISYSDTTYLRVVKSGTTFYLYYGNTQIGSASTISDAGVISNTLHGLFSTYSANQLKNFVVYPQGTANEFSELDRF